ncbi:MAG: NUDIX domain-containing protein [SAR324 cluster bacterium]|nr:NUDIX domain-containing protein [SAR324 cluster bacterium]
MEIREVILEHELGRIPPGTVAFDLEVANSFRSEHAVICMVGLETYSATERHCVNRIASITKREDEAQLVGWFLDEVGRMAESSGEVNLLSFSGQDNDLPWLNERLQRLAIGGSQRSILQRVGHVDLKVEFYRRTQNDQISLKKLERIFGIERESNLQSRKVSFILTDIVRGRRPDARIPEKIFRYLHEDVHHLMLIHDRWGEVSLTDFRLTEEEYLRFVNSLQNAGQRLVQTIVKRNLAGRNAIAILEKFLEAMHGQLKRALEHGTFASFVLPPLPEMSVSHSEMERVRKKHDRLRGMVLRDEKTGAYLLRSDLSKPKGALAVVHHDGRLLMIRRADNLKRAGGHWGLPGGVVEEGESPLQCAVRELREEVNLVGRPAAELGASTSYSGEYDLIWVAVEVDDVSTIRPAADEVAEVRWVEPGQVAKLDPLIPGALEGFRRILGQEWG